MLLPALEKLSLRGAVVSVDDDDQNQMAKNLRNQYAGGEEGRKRKEPSDDEDDDDDDDEWEAPISLDEITREVNERWLRQKTTLPEIREALKAIRERKAAEERAAAEKAAAEREAAEREEQASGEEEPGYQGTPSGLRTWEEAGPSQPSEPGPSQCPSSMDRLVPDPDMPGKWKAVRFGGTYELGMRLALSQLAARYWMNTGTYNMGDKSVMWQFDSSDGGPKAVISTKGAVTFSNFTSEEKLKTALQVLVAILLKYRM